MLFIVTQFVHGAFVQTKNAPNEMQDKCDTFITIHRRVDGSQETIENSTSNKVIFIWAALQITYRLSMCLCAMVLYACERAIVAIEKTKHKKEKKK